MRVFGIGEGFYECLVFFFLIEFRFRLLYDVKFFRRSYISMCVYGGKKIVNLEGVDEYFFSFRIRVKFY